MKPFGAGTLLEALQVFVYFSSHPSKMRKITNKENDLSKIAWLERCKA